jgi:hypothetical protein
MPQKPPFPPPPQDFQPPPVPAPKEKLRKRKWVQITGTAVVAFIIGLAAAGSPEPTPATGKADRPAVTAPAKNDAALTKATREAERLKTQVAALHKHEKLVVARVQGRARAAQRTAVRAATAQVRAQARAQQRRAVAAAVSQTKADAATESVSAPTDDSSGGGGDVYYENCDAARAAGAAPISQGEPGYASHLDRDGDGVGCDS